MASNADFMLEMREYEEDIDAAPRELALAQ